MVKRLFDMVLAAVGLIFASAVLLPALIAIWLQDFRSPFYVAPRVGKGGRMFRMIKLRSMVTNADQAGGDSTSANADQAGGDSTSANDDRITPVGHIIRACKLDELSQLWNVLVGDMSLVGPRPNVVNETDRYTPVEKGLLSVRPGITDISSIVFSDEGRILADSADPDLDYNRLIRPWKSRLGILYIENRSLALDFALIAVTAVAILSRRTALKLVDRILASIDAPPDIRTLSRRESRLLPTPPPGADRPVIAADLYGPGAVA